MVEELGWEWRWLKRYHRDMVKAIEKTIMDGKERGFFITRNKYINSAYSPQRIARSRIQTGTAGNVTLTMKPLDLQVDDALISFHTHSQGMDCPSERDEKTAVALGETYTVIGYANEDEPHIKVWRIKHVEGTIKTGLIKKI